MWRGFCALPLALSLWAQQPAPPESSIQKDFEKRVEGYLKLRKTALEGIEKLKPTVSPETIQFHEKAVAHRLRELRRDAIQGNIFSPEIAADFITRIRGAFEGAQAGDIRKSLQRAEPVRLKSLRVNGSYPKGVPLQSTPPTLLLNLPKVPTELEYRVTGRALVLLDVGANLIVDYIPDALPAGANAP